MKKLTEIFRIIWEHHEAIDQILHMLKELFPDDKPQEPKP